MNFRWLACSSLLSLNFALANGAAPPAAGGFIDGEVLMAQQDAEMYRFYTELKSRLLSDFNSACQSSFCKNSDYGSFAIADFRCSVEADTKIAKSCYVYVVATRSKILQATGQLKIASQKTFTCPVNFLGTLGVLMKVWADSVERPNGSLLNAKLPEVSTSLGQQLEKCLPSS